MAVEYGLRQPVHKTCSVVIFTGAMQTRANFWCTRIQILGAVGKKVKKRFQKREGHFPLS